MNNALILAANAFPLGNARRVCKRGLVLARAIAALLLFASLAAAASVAHPSKESGQRAGVLIGHDAAGLAVYRLPPVNVTVDRKAVLAALDAEESR